MSDEKILTTHFGAPVPDNEHSLSAGERGPLLLQDYFLLEKLAHFDRERIPERVVHAKGAGAFGYVEASADMSRHTRAHLFGEAGRKTPALVRFSTVGGEKGSSDTDRDPRGFAMKFYTDDPFDVTKVWRYKDYPLIPIGRLVLDRNPTNFFAEIEQAAFSPSNFVPGVEPSPDKLLQGRLFSYPDTQRHRLGPNFAQIPVNCPFSTSVNNYQRDGLMRVDGNGKSEPNYSPNGRGGPVADARAAEIRAPLAGTTGRTEYPQADRADDFEQAGLLYRVMPDDERARLVASIAGHLGGATRDVQRRQLQHFLLADAEYGARVAKALGLTPKDAIPIARR